ncbi:MAG: hypothetical protein IKV94_01715 [Clostridia bacterium]|nr:hypothetical protein [Clostridia bacterium]
MKVDFIHDVTKDQVAYFTEITKHDRCRVMEWLKGQNGETAREKRFLEFVSQAVTEINYDYMIATIEPSVVNGRIFYSAGKDVGIGFSDNEWETMAANFCPNMGSRLAEMKELCIWYALRIVDGGWTLDYITMDSSIAGNYRNSPNSTKDLEKTGVVKAGNYNDGQGNTYKIVKTKYGFAHVGGAFYHYGFDFPVAFAQSDGNPSAVQEYGSGVVVLTNYKKVST